MVTYEEPGVVTATLGSRNWDVASLRPSIMITGGLGKQVVTTGLGDISALDMGSR